MPKKNREQNVFGLSFMDVLANTIGGLAFLLVIAVLMVGSLVDTSPPRIVTESLPDAYVGKPYTVWLAAQGGGGSYAWSLVGNDLEWITIDEESGRLEIDWEKAPKGNEMPDEISLTVKCGTSKEDENAADATDDDVDDGVESDDDTKPNGRQQVEFELALLKKSDHGMPVRVTTERLPGAFGDQPFPLRLACEGGRPKYAWSIAAGKLPEGLQLAKDGVFTGAPIDTGTFKFTVAVTDEHESRDTRALQLTVSTKYEKPDDPPLLKLVTSKLTAAVADRDYTIFPAAEGGVLPYDWSIEGAPRWLRIEGNRITGQPRSADVDRDPDAPAMVVLRVSDAKGAMKESKPLPLSVLAPPRSRPQPLAIHTNAILPQARVDLPYDLAIAVKGGVPPYEFEFKETTAGLGLDTLDDGRIKGDPTSPESFRTTVTVTDDADVAVTRELELAIKPAEQDVLVHTGRAPIGRVGLNYELALSASGGYAPYVWTFEGELPPGLHFDNETGVITGVPSEPGTWTGSATVVDAEGESPEDPTPVPLVFRIDSPRGNPKLVIKTDTIPALLRDEPTGLTMATEGGLPPFTWSLPDGGPEGMAFEDESFVGTPTAAGTYETTFEVRDEEGQTATVTLPVAVRHMAPFWWLVLLGILLAIALFIVAILARVSKSWQPVPLEITSEALPNARASSEYAVQLAAHGGVGPYTWTLVDGELPPGLELTDEGLLHGKPFEGVSIDETKEMAFTVEVRDRANRTARREL